MTAASAISLNEGRFARFEAIEWWNQSLLRDARILVVGAGALGNEVLKNLALLGIGNIVVIDMDRIELSNLSRSVLFRESDEGQPKTEAAARAARAIYPGLRIHPIHGNLLSDVGLGFFRWAQIVIGALDNREARVFVNAACARTGRPWIDGGIEVLNGVVRGFSPPATACYECTMSDVDWQILNKRRSCSMLARRALEQRGTPTTPTTASIIGAIQTQEALKFLHGIDALFGRGFVFEGRNHQSYSTTYPINPDCPWHEAPPEIIALPDAGLDTPLQALADEAGRRLGGFDALDLAREIVEHLECPKCHRVEVVLKPAEKVSEDQALCSGCGIEAAPKFLNSIASGNPLLAKTARELGLPAWEILWARYGGQSIGLELAGDNPFHRPPS
ncbi:MAG: molybdopterin-synthase adenylyltransferase [Verrucomicrobiota bacterium]